MEHEIKQGTWAKIFDKAKNKKIKVNAEYQDIKKGLYHYRMTNKSIYHRQSKHIQFKITDFGSYCFIEKHIPETPPKNIHIL